MWVISFNTFVLYEIYFEMSTRSGMFLMVRNLPNLVPKHSSIEDCHMQLYTRSTEIDDIKLYGYSSHVAFSCDCNGSVVGDRDHARGMDTVCS